MIRSRPAHLIWTREVCSGIIQQRFSSRLIARRARSGQFVHLLPGPNYLFRRAFSVYMVDSDAGTFDVLYQILGDGTRYLAQLAEGTRVDTLGPLGNCFPSPLRRHRPVLVGGGVGMAPLRLFAHEILESGQTRHKTDAHRRPLMLLGARTRSLAVTPSGLSALGLRPVWATDDGSRGFHGNVVACLEDQIGQGRIEPTKSVVYSCGPESMMRALAESCAEHAILCYVSLERLMPCGYGVCMGCVVQTKNGEGYDTHKRVCRDGPVFDAAEVRL